MTEVKILEAVLKKHLKLNAARLNFLSNFIIALLKVRTVNLTEIAGAFWGKVHIPMKSTSESGFISTILRA